MPMNVSLPVSAAAPSPSPASSSSSAASALAAAGSGSAAAGAAAANGAPSGGQSAGQNSAQAGDGSASVANGATSANSAQQTSAANAPSQGPADQGDAFARLLEAQLGTIAAEQGTAPQPGATAAADDKPATVAKTAKAQDTGATVDPNLLPNPALLALQQAAVPVVQPTALAAGSAASPAAAAPGAAGPASAAVGAAAAAGAAGAAKLALPDPAAAQNDLVSRDAATDKLALAGFALNHDGKDDSLQKLPQNTAGQPAQTTILPPNAQQPLAAEAQKTQQANAPTFHVPQQVGTPDWSKSVGDQVMAMVNLKAETAHIQLNPPQLGPIEVTLKMDAHNNAQVTFAADSPATRAALQDSLPRLHSMMAAGGIQLGDAQVSSGQSQRQQQSFAGNRSGLRNEQPEPEEGDTLASIKAARGVLSIFA
jgi:flagellar hook-length control protein FliK